MSTKSSTAAPAPDALASTREYWIEQRKELLTRVAEIEKFLGFAETSEELAVRVAKLEAFLGMDKS